MIDYKNLGVIESFLIGLLGLDRLIHIVQIGAHNGKDYDPIYSTLKLFPNKSKILLVEPQNIVLEDLEKNYQWHSNYKIAKELVGDGLVKYFYSIKPEYYEFYKYDFVTRDVPSYVHPTGVSSFSYNTFMKHYNKYFQNQELDFEQVVFNEKIKSLTLNDLVKKYNIKKNIDLLCIDAEGSDDIILYSNDWDECRPQTILFEQMHFDLKQKTNIVKFLENKDYLCVDIVEHILAISLI
jgi:FkbM family methyltransferase